VNSTPGCLVSSSLVATATIVTLIAGVRIGAQQVPRFGERVDVARIIVDARVLDDRGNPIPGLTADDFKVSIDGKTARVETATWVGERGTGPDVPSLESTPLREADAPASPGRLIVFLFQKDYEPSRIFGLMKMLLKSRNILETLTPNDRVAILSFDSHLKIWTDFTNDRERLDHVLGHDLLLERPPVVRASPVPSLVERLDPETGRRTYGIERALELIGEALEPLPGSKSLVLIGYGFGRLGFSGVSMENDYGPARHALVASRTSVFSLDVTNADYHSLEVGLQIVSEQTGGFYARTHLFPDIAMRQLAGALAGYYVLFIEKPESQRAVHDIETELTRRKGRVLATSSFSERDP
jgi:VWFA-related protein